MQRGRFRGIFFRLQRKGPRIRDGDFDVTEHYMEAVHGLFDGNTVARPASFPRNIILQTAGKVLQLSPNSHTER
jgi:hypothetical protein